MISSRYKNDGKSIRKLNTLQVDVRDAITRKINQKHYKFEAVKCCICNGENFELLSEKDRYGLYQSVVVCVDCGLVQTNPRMDLISYSEFYDSEYRSLYVGVDSPTEAFFQRQVFQGRRVYEFIVDKAKIDLRGKFVFEVGCGAGGILKPFQDAGCEVAGCDLGQKYLEYGKKHHGLNLYHGSLCSIKLDRKPDIILYSHVFEHVLDVKNELSVIYETLSDDGFLFIEVPGINNISKSSVYKSDFLDYLQNAHTYHFTLKTLTNLLRNSNFKLLVGNEYVQSVFSKGGVKQLTSSDAIDYDSDYVSVKKELARIEKHRKFEKFRMGKFSPWNILRVIRLNYSRLLNG